MNEEQEKQWEGLVLVAGTATKRIMKKNVLVISPELVLALHQRLEHLEEIYWMYMELED